MPERRAGSKPTWTQVKARLAGFDRLVLLALIQDLYAANKDNQAFLHARLGLGEDNLEPYRKQLDRWLWPDPFRNQDVSIVKAKQAISSYKKAAGEPAGMAELMVYYCECAAGFCDDVGYQDESFFNSLVLMFEQALMVIAGLPDSAGKPLIARLEQVCTTGHGFGYGVGDAMDDLLAPFVD